MLVLFSWPTRKRKTYRFGGKYSKLMASYWVSPSWVDQTTVMTLGDLHRRVRDEITGVWVRLFRMEIVTYSKLTIVVKDTLESFAWSYILRMVIENMPLYHFNIFLLNSQRVRGLGLCHTCYVLTSHRSVMILGPDLWQHL